jgi:hypothetical protein
LEDFVPHEEQDLPYVGPHRNPHPAPHRNPKPAPRPAPPQPPKPVVNSVNLVQYCGDVLDQGNLGSCTAHAIRGSDDLLENVAGQSGYHLCRLALYWQERIAEGQSAQNMQDTGADPMDGLRILASQGICDESLYPYNDTLGDTQPPAVCFEAANCSAHKVHTIGTVAAPGTAAANLIQALENAFAQKIPVVTCFAVYESFESAAVAKNGIVPMPRPGEQMLGGHAVLMIGIDAVNQRFILRNSWGASWGDHGNFYLPFAYVTSANLCFELIAITKY